MEDRINQALSQIERDLQNIKSAREQVDSVVSSSEQLKERVGSFVSDVNTLSKQVEGLIQSLAEQGKSNIVDFEKSLEDLKKACATVVSSFEKETTVAASTIKMEINNLHDEVERLEEARSNLVVATNAIKNLNDDVEKLTTELKESQSAQDNDLQAIKEQLTGFLTQLLDTSKKADAIQHSIQDQNNTLNQLLQSLNAANTALSGISPLIQTVQSSLSNQIQNETNQISQSLNTSIIESKQTLDHNINDGFEKQNSELRSIYSDLDKDIANRFNKLDNDIKSEVQNTLDIYQKNNEKLEKKVNFLQILLIVQVVISVVIIVLMAIG